MKYTKESLNEMSIIDLKDLYNQLNSATSLIDEILNNKTNEDNDKEAKLFFNRIFADFKCGDFIRIDNFSKENEKLTLIGSWFLKVPNIDKCDLYDFATFGRIDIHANNYSFWYSTYRNTGGFSYDDKFSLHVDDVYEVSLSSDEDLQKTLDEFKIKYPL